MGWSITIDVIFFNFPIRSNAIFFEIQILSTKLFQFKIHVLIIQIF